MERIREHGEMLRQAAWIHATRWNDDEREKVKGWIEKHGGDLDIVAQALEKPTFRIPLVRETENTPLLVSLPRMTGFFREIAAGLQCRCRYRLQTGDNDGAWSDLKTLILLYRKSDGSIWIRAGFADQSDELFRCLLTEGNLSEELLRRMDDDLDGDLDDVPVHEAIFPTFNKERKDVLLTARYMVLDAISLASVAPDSFLDALFFPPDLPPTERQRIADLIKMIGVDMNIITKKTNGYFDLFVPAADADDPEIRRTLDRKSFVEAEKTAMRDIEEHIEEHLSKLFLVSSRSELIGDVIGDQILSTVVRYIADEYDQQERRVVYRTQIALERYKRKHGEYPLTTESLVPEFLPGVPVGGVDPETPVSYTPDENRSGYVLVQKRCTGFPFFETETAEEPVRIPYDPGNEAHENRVHGGPHGH